MSDLAALQASFQAAVTDGGRGFAGEIVSTERVGAERRIAIYADAYRLRLVEVLQDNYPGLHRLLGDDAFDSLARRYIETTPSTFRSARWYGHRLAEFIDSADGLPSRDLLSEMARTDWTMGLAFDAADAETRNEADMAAVEPAQWGALVFTLHPSVHHLDLLHDVPPMRATLLVGDDVEPPDRREAPVRWLIWRRKLTVHYRSLAVDEAFALDAARAGSPFADICGGLTEWNDEQHAPLRAVELLKQWLVDGLIAHIRQPAD